MNMAQDLAGGLGGVHVESLEDDASLQLLLVLMAALTRVGNTLKMTAQAGVAATSL
jgi:hypothetical protein